MKSAVVFEARRTGYGIDKIERPMTVGELKEMLEDFEDDDLVVCSHDYDYSFGSLSNARVFEEMTDGKWYEC